MSNTTYTDRSIKLLKGLEPIKLRPGMFIGSTESPDHLLTEIIDNSLDEILNDYGDILYVQIDTDKNIYSVYDNGRGIPIGLYEDEYIPILLASHLFSGGKFDNDSYELSAGLHGVGMAAVNALSSQMEIEIYRDKKHFYCKFENSILVDNKIENFSDVKPFSTKITFQPDKQYFDNVKINIQKIEERLNFTSIFVKNDMKFYLDIDGNKWCPNNEDKKKRIQNLFTSYKDSELLLPFTEIEVEEKNKIGDQKITQKLIVHLFYTNQPSREIKGSINLLPVHQGTHINMFQNTIMDIFEKIKDHNDSFKKEDSTLGIRALVTLFTNVKEFDNQVKTKFSISKNSLINIFNKLKTELYNLLKNKPDLISNFNSYRNAITKAKHVIVRQDQVRGMINIKSKLRDCSSTDVEKCELFLVEGESAAGAAIQARNNSYHAILELKGKVINAITHNMSKILLNDEVIDILSSSGINIKEKNKTKLRYGKIIILCDADADGGHIASLLIGMFLKLYPEIFEQKSLYWCNPPLYGYWDKKKFIPLWTEQEMNSVLVDNPSIHMKRFKGLGEMSPEELEISAFVESTRRLIQLDKPENENNIFDALKSAEKKWYLVTHELDDILNHFLGDETSHENEIT